MPLADPAADPAAEASAPTFSHALRVYWEDTDAGGVVFYANYLKYLERARTEWLRSLGVEQGLLRARDGAIFVVSEASLRYRAPARLDDWLRVTVRLEQHGTASLTLAQQVFRDAALLVEGRIRVACVADGTFKPRRIPTAVLALFLQ